ncbi:MAG: STAS domain-containing protein [Verrucomicrobiota bacterium]
MKFGVDELSSTVTKVTLSGRLDMDHSEEIDERFAEITENSAKHLIVDMSEVKFIASIGIRTLVTSAKTLKKQGKKMLLLRPQGSVEKVLDIAGITAVIPVFGEEASALSELE